ncbi:MAG: electron transfer flavoprotein subunit beta/FixA family protein [Acidilobus sp.]
MKDLGDLVVLLKPALNPEMIRGTPDGLVDFDYMPLKLSDIDRNAVEEAVRLRDTYFKGSKIYSISVATWGPVGKRDKDIKMAIQEGLAKGVDEAYIVEDDSITPGDPVATASAIAAVIRRFGLEPDLVLSGEATIDGFSGQVAGRVAAKLGYPYVSFARKIDVKEGRLIAERDVEDYVEVVESPLPAVVSVTREINAPRPPTLIQIRMASRKPQHVLTLKELEGVTPARKRLTEARVLAVKRKQAIIEGKTAEETADKLIDALVSEGVIKE